jgi:hypothetical protein
MPLATNTVQAQEPLEDIGVFCLSPRKGSIQILGSPAIRGEFGECADDHINLERG